MADLVSSARTIPGSAKAVAATEPERAGSLAETGLSNGRFVAPASPGVLIEDMPPPAAPLPSPYEERIDEAKKSELAWSDLLAKAGALLDTYPPQPEEVVTF